VKRHWETHLYSFAVALACGEAISAENLLGVRAKAILRGHTEGECMCVEKDPHHYIRTGAFA